MTILSGIVLFVVIWWPVFFCVLPVGMKQPDERVPGEMPGAPAAPDLKRKALWTTLIAAIIWLAVYGLILADLFSFRRPKVF